MSGVRIEDDAFGDTRYDVLARACGLADADHARGKMARLWRQCTAESVYVLPVEDVESVLGANAVAGLERARLGERVKAGVRIRGTKGRIEWLEKLRDNGKFGKLGGRPKRNPRGLAPGIPDGPPSGSGELTPLVPALAPVPVPVLVPVHSESEIRNIGLASLDLVRDADRPGKVSKPGKRKSDLTDSERETAARVLAKITDRTGIEYGTKGGDVHVRLVAARLRDGITERELRAVIGYCWAEDGGLGWKSKTTGDGEPMATYLRPETLFGPKKIAQYLPPAIAWADKLSPPRQPAPSGAVADVAGVLFSRHAEAR